MPIYDGLALVISVQGEAAVDAPGLKDCHEEAENVAQLYKRFDNEVV